MTITHSLAADVLALGRAFLVLGWVGLLVWAVGLYRRK